MLYFLPNSTFLKHATQKREIFCNYILRKKNPGKGSFLNHI